MRDHVLAGRSFDSLTELDEAFGAWLPIRRGQIHRTHGQVISVRAEADRAALRPLPELPYLVSDRHLRRVGKDCLVSFEASWYSLPARKIRPGQTVELRVTGELVALHALGAAGGELLAVHPRATRRGSWAVDQSHWDGLPDGHTRATVREPATADRAVSARGADREPSPLAALLATHHAAGLPVARRPLTDYHAAATDEPTHPNLSDRS